MFRDPEYFNQPYGIQSRNYKKYCSSLYLSVYVVKRGWVLKVWLWMACPRDLVL